MVGLYRTHHYHPHIIFLLNIELINNLFMIENITDVMVVFMFEKKFTKIKTLQEFTECQILIRN